MRFARMRGLGLLAALLIAGAASAVRAQAPAAAPAPSSRPQAPAPAAATPPAPAAAPASSPSAAPARDDIVNALGHFDGDSNLELDLTALKQKISDRSKMRGKNEPEPAKRPLIVPELKGLPTFNFNIHFDVDTPIILSDSYETVGRIADAMVNAPMLPYMFLIVGHTDSTGRREANVILSQRRADALRDVLVNTFKISAKRLSSLGLGEEQFIDQARPTSPVNLQIQIVTTGKVPDTEPAAPTTTPAKKSAKKKK
jgi:outer membrane protein OmpA-like peptidoglycan-associated protein